MRAGSVRAFRWPGPLAARLLLAVGLLALLLLTVAAPPAGAQTGNDYDTDDDRLIEITTPAQLNAVRYDLDGDGLRGTVTQSDWDANYAAAGVFPNPSSAQCPSGCQGYELDANLDLSTDYSAGFTPIGETYSGLFNGRGHTISGLTVNVSSGRAGLFAQVSGTIREVGVLNPSVTSTVGTQLGVGGLAGRVSSTGRVYGSYVSGGTITIAGNNLRGGGLVGRTSNGAIIQASYATAAVTTDALRVSIRAGGLVGNNSGAITASYAAGTVNPNAPGSGSNIGGLVGYSIGGGNNSITNSYCSAATGQTNCIGGQSGNSVSSTRYSAAQMQFPIGYSGIYANWNVDVDGASGNDEPWNFGSSSQYPTLWTPADRQPQDYDANDNGLIDISTAEQLDAVRHDLNGNGDATHGNYIGAFHHRTTGAGTDRMGCPSGTCTGYELTADLTLTTTWTDALGDYTATFDGRGHTITGLRVVSTASGNFGLFGSLGAAAVVRDVGLVNATITPQATAAANHGILAGSVAAGATVSAVYASGGTVTTNANSSTIGGLVGLLQGDLRAAWSTAAVTISLNRTGVNIGGLAGHLNGGSLTAAYAAGAVTQGTGANVNNGGLVGQASDNSGDTSEIANSYCDTGVTTQTDCIGTIPTGSAAVAAAGYGATALQTPTDYTGIYRNWNLDLGSDGDLDYPWDFGTSSEYPTLHTPTERAALVPSATDYDWNNNGLIDITTQAQLNAIRWDGDGDGDPDSASYNAYGTTFSGRQHTADADAGRMGCPVSGCTGYELLTNLTLTGAWTPIASYTATFDGHGYTISGLNVSVSSGHAGLFGTVSTANGVIRNVGLISPSVTSSAASQGSGALTGQLGANANVETSYATGGSVTVSGTGGAQAGGLVGSNLGAVKASYATVAVSATGNPASVALGGLVGYGQTSEIVASYAAGAVTASTGSGASGRRPAGDFQRRQRQRYRQLLRHHRHHADQLHRRYHLNLHRRRRRPPHRRFAVAHRLRRPLSELEPQSGRRCGHRRQPLEFRQQQPVPHSARPQRPPQPGARPQRRRRRPPSVAPRPGAAASPTTRRPTTRKSTRTPATK